jgi:hypothetical protein
MEYYAVGLALVGAAAGLAFRWKVLLPIICLLPAALIIFPVSPGLSFLDTALAVIAAEAFLQGGYCVGLLSRAIADACLRSKRG